MSSLLRQKRRPVLVGVVLGLLVVLQFFISTEILLIVAIVGVGGIALIVVYGALQSPEHPDAPTARPAVVGLGVGGATAFALLAYPAWFALEGPARFSGLIWPNGFPQPFSNVVLKYFVYPAPAWEGTELSQGWRRHEGATKALRSRFNVSVSGSSSCSSWPSSSGATTSGSGSSAQ